VVNRADAAILRSSPGSLAMFAAMRHAFSLVSNLAAERRPALGRRDP
jgi:hypothetical protein